MWFIFALGSAFFSGITAILAKCGIRETDSVVATAVRTIVVLIFAWFMVFLTGSFSGIKSLSAHTWVFLALSGIATGASWLCYFRALQIGDINKVVPIDKSSTVLSMLLAFLFLGEAFSLASGAAMVLILAGTLMMIQKKAGDEVPVAAGRAGGEVPVAAGRAGGEASVAAGKNSAAAGKAWMVYAVLSAVFASLTSILGKIGIEGVESNLGTAIRTGVVLVMAWIVVFAAKKQDKVGEIPPKELLFICLSGIATGGAWLCYYRALQDGPASVVVPVDKLSILITIAFSCLVFGEKLTRRAAAGLVLIAAGTLLMTLPALGVHA